MIKNKKQASLTKEKLQKLKNAKAEFQRSNQDGTTKYELGIKSFDSLIVELESELNEYSSLLEGNFHCFQPKSLQEIPKVLIAARLAQKMSQRELGELVGIKEQQIQRYEASDYETASWPRIIEISMALGLKFLFDKILIINCSQDCFEFLDDVSHREILALEANTKSTGSLII